VPEKGKEMKNTIRTIAAVVTLTLVICWATLSQAQSNDATLTGTVVDKTGAVIPGAQIVITDEASGVARSTTSDGRGFFSLVGIPVATYDVQVSASGFNSLVRKGVAVHINDQVELKNIALTVAGATASVVVTAEAEELTPTTSGEVSYTISDTQMHNMNLEGRSAIELLGLVPGAGNTGNFTNSGYDSNQAGFTQNASTYTVNGNRFDQVAIVSDGASVTDLNTAGGASVTPNVDMIAELKVQSAAYSAAEPNGPIVVSTETKAGGRDFHGEAYLSARNYNMDATDWQQKANGLPKSQTSLYYPGMNIGGPVILPGVSRDHAKLFFFAAMEYAQQHVDQGVRKAAIPTEAMVGGDFSNVWNMDLSNAANGYEYWPVSTYPCGSGQSYCSGSGVIAKTSIDPAGKILLGAVANLANLFPKYYVDPLTHAGNNFISDFTTSNPRNQEILRMDYAITNNAHLSGRYNHENESVPWPYGPYNVWNQLPYPAAQTGKDASNSFSGTLTNTLSQSLTNEASLAYTRFTLKEALGNLSAVSLSALNYPYQNLFSTSTGILPNVDFGGGSGGEINNEQLYINGNEAPPYLNAQNGYTINDALTKVKGKHLLKAGFFGQMGLYNNRTGGNDNGTISTQDYSTATGNLWADLLLGYTSEFTQSSSNIEASMRAKRFDFFAQDTWKALSKLTLNYGLRVDHIGAWYDSKGRIAIFNPAAYVASSSYTAYTGMQTHATTPSVPLSGSKPLGFQWAPSLGFAYDLSGSGKTVVRGGIGTNYYSDPGINAYSAIEAPPNFQVATLYASSTPGYTLSGISALNFSTALPVVWGTAYPSDHRVPVTYSWNMALAHTFPGANKIEANYVGNISRNLVGYGVQNAVPEGKETGPYYGTYYDQLYRPFANYGDISTHFHNLNSNYNALQLTLTRQKGWLNYWGSYAFGKSLAYNAEDAFDMKRWYGPTPFDRSQILSFSYFLKMPSFSKRNLGNHALVNGALGGWNFSGIFQASTGGPIGNNFGSEYAANRNTIGIYGNNVTLGGAQVDGTPDEVAAPVMTCDPRKGLARGQYFNPGCFTAPSVLSNGTYRLPYIHGPAYINDSTGLFKTFGLGESRKLEIRGEVFNLFNHPWNEFLASDPRMYIGFNVYGGRSVTPLAGTVNNETGHRQIQLAGKFYF